MKVNMTPNPLDVVTIHASQGDTEARQWEFELHNNGEVIDAGGITEQMVFKSYKDGTEEILPSGLLNGSVDLGSLTWEYQSEYTRFRASLTGFKPATTQYVSGNILCDKYTVGSMQETQTVNNVIAIGASGINYVYIKDTSYTDATAFKESLQGVYLWYETTDSTPTTSPFLGNIKYPQWLLTDQEFTYRQSPAEEDGLAKITDIKGNTLVWNQLIRNGNFADTSNWSAESGATLSISNNIATISSTVANNGIIQYFPNPLTVGHKYLIKAEFNVPTEYRCVIGTAANQGVQTDKLISTANTWTEVSGIGTCTIATTSFYCFVRGTTYENVKIRNVMCFDLTQMGLDITDPSEFTSLFSLPYYAYNQGSLLSFNGNGIKTVGKNIFDGVLQNGTIDQYGQEQPQANRYRTDFLRVFPSTRYVISVDGVIKNVNIFYYDINKNFISSIGGSLVTTPSNCAYMRFYYDQSIFNVNLQLEMLTSGDRPTPYEPYTSSTISLPISTYFPNGMKSAKNAYDELSNTKASVRIGSITLNGSEAWVKSASYQGNYYVLGLLSDVKYPGPNAISNSLILVYNTTQLSANDLCFMFDGSAGSYNVNIKNTSMTPVDHFKAWLQANPVTIYYELKTPTETSFTTASLATENGEVALANENGVLVGKCNSDISADAGFIEGKIKLSDEDGDVYSNKIQIHVERSPQ